MAKNHILGLILAKIWAPIFLCVWILSLLVARHCFNLSSFAILREINEPNLRKTSGPNLVQKFFFLGFTSFKSYTLLQAIILSNLNKN